MSFCVSEQTALYNDPVRTALYTLFISVIKTSQFTLYCAEAVVCSEINSKHINTGLAETTVVEC
jgi:hypothetical protein